MTNPGGVINIRETLGPLKGAESRFIMFEVTEKATEVIQDYFKDKASITPLRVYLAQGG